MSRWPAIVLLVAGCALAACSAILGLDDGKEHPFEHRAHVLEGVNCLDCHRGVEKAGEEGPIHIPTTEDCVACHEQPHDPSPCSGCHGAAWIRNGAVQARRHLRFEHPAHVDATDGNCIRCHAQVGRVDGPLRPGMPNCFSCHQHEDQWEATDCDGCHVDMQAEGTLPQSHVIHGPDFMREHGVRAASTPELCTACHTQRSCTGCHGVTVPVLPTRLRFDQPERADMHRAGFSLRHALEARADPAMCVTCHTESSCRDCHARENVAAGQARGRSPHPPGWVGLPGQSNTHGRAARLDPVSCASCHTGGEQLCVDCHAVGAPGGNPHPPGFSSRKPRSDMPCRMCHRSGP